MRRDDWFEAFVERRVLIDKGFDLVVALVAAALLYTCSQLVKMATDVSAPPPLPLVSQEPTPPPIDTPIPPKSTPALPGVEARGGGPILGQNGQPFADSYNFRCTNDKGVQGEFHAAIFLHQYNWEYGADGVQLAGATQSFDSILHEEGLREALGSARELISIGTASCEGGKEGEEIRAANRAVQLSARVRGIIKPPHSAPTINSYYVNLGQFRPEEADRGTLCNGKDSSKTRSQRKIILVAIDRQDDQLDLQWCLGQILAKCPDLDRYSNFDNFQLTW